MRLWCFAGIIIGILAGTYKGMPLTKLGKDLQMKLVHHANTPFIDYKYITKTILPSEDNWWKRGTHHFYADETAKVVRAR
ncbi:unnamed protein product [Phyllotreta striolata]|uniref:Uncharacterized protein n=1 Tax=Phyllotreta striolata TaxID=444603 RepID=A0A9N9XLL9_PHYSR|nr:unnamed protein product [Phyllotreta striolata]